MSATNYGPSANRPPPNSMRRGVIDLTKKYVASQPPGASFDTAPVTKTWRCACGRLNTRWAMRCHVCGKAKS